MFPITHGSILISWLTLGVDGVSRFHHPLIIVCIVSVAHNFTELHSGWAEYDYLAFGELSRFVFCLLRKLKRSQDLLVIERWQIYMLPNHSCFGALEWNHFPEGTHLLSSLEKKTLLSSEMIFAKTVVIFWRNSRVAARSPVRQGLSCFCPKTVIGVMIIQLFIYLDYC